MSKAHLSYHVKKFSEKVRAMNDANSTSLTLTAAEARSLHTDIFALLTKITELTTVQAEPEPTTINVDCGKF